MNRLLQGLAFACLLTTWCCCSGKTVPDLDEYRYQVRFEPRPNPLPYPRGGLAFQMNQLTADSGEFRPIGSARFGPEGDVYITFPDKDLVARFDDREGNRFYGPTVWGGQGEIITDPQQLDFVADRMHLSAKTRPRLAVIDTTGVPHGNYQMRFPGPVSGPDNRFIVADPLKPHNFFQVDADDRTLREYNLPVTLKVRPFWRILPNWEIVVWSADGRYLFRLDESGTTIGRFEIDTNPAAAGGQVAALDIHLSGRLYWLLLGVTRADGQRDSYLMILDPDGFAIHTWWTPFYADGFHLDESHLLLYQKQAGALMTYLRTEL